MNATRRTKTMRLAALLPLLAPMLGGCGSSPASYIHPNIDFGHIQRVAVLPFENLTADRLAGERMHSIFLIEILEEGVLQIIDTRETVAAMRDLDYTPGTALTPDQSVSLGHKLDVDALFFGVVEEYGYSKGDRRRGPEITAAFGMIETETGVEIWRAHVHSTGASVWRKLFGGGTADLYSVSREVVRDALGTLL